GLIAMMLRQNKGPRMKRLLLTSFLIPAVLAVGACSEKPQPKLEGQRIDVTLQPAVLMPDSAAGGEAVAIPGPDAPTDGPTTAGNSAHQPGHLALHDHVTRAWTYRLGGGSSADRAILNPPVVSAGRVFATNTKGQVAAVDAKTGKEIWERTLPL